MSSKSAALNKLALAVATRHKAHLARLSAVNAQIARVDASIAELHKAPLIEEDSAFQAVGARHSWAFRKEQHLLQVRAALQVEAAKHRARAARSHGEEQAAERLRDTQKAAQKAAMERQLEREAPLPKARGEGNGKA